jgi:predicted nucleic acid-binding protein
MSVILADTGVLLALLDRRERFHAWAVEQAKSLQVLITCEAVVTELCFLLAEAPAGRAAVRNNFASRAWRLNFSLEAEQVRVFALMETYADQPMSLADACLVRMAELQAEAKIFTLDGHFRVYRRNRRQILPLIIPAEL